VTEAKTKTGSAKTKTKTKTMTAKKSICMERSRDQDRGLEDYKTDIKVLKG